MVDVGSLRWPNCTVDHVREPVYPARRPLAEAVGERSSATRRRRAHGQTGRLAAVGVLLERGADPNATGPGGETVLAFAVRSVRSSAGPCVQALLGAGADPDALIDGLTPLALARHPEVIAAPGGDATRPPAEVIATLRAGGGLDAVEPWLNLDTPIDPELIDALLAGAGLPQDPIAGRPGTRVRDRKKLLRLVRGAAAREPSLSARLVTPSTWEVWADTFCADDASRAMVLRDAPAILDVVAGVIERPPAVKFDSPWFAAS